MTDGSGGAIVLPTTSTVPTLPAIPIETLPTVPDLTAPSVPLPTVPNLPVDPTSPTVSTGPGSGSSTSPGSGTSPASTTSSPATTTSTMPADCPPRSPTQTTDPPEESSLPPSDSSIPSSEPEQQPTTQPPEATTPIDACPPGFDDPALHPLPSEIVDDELGTVALLAGIEVVAVNAYTMVLGAATAGSLGAVPPAVAHYGATALDHHRVALDAWNRVLMAVGRPAVTQPPADPGDHDRRTARRHNRWRSIARRGVHHGEDRGCDLSRRPSQARLGARDPPRRVDPVSRSAAHGRAAVRRRAVPRARDVRQHRVRVRPPTRVTPRSSACAEGQGHREHLGGRGVRRQAFTRFKGGRTSPSNGNGRLLVARSGRYLSGLSRQIEPRCGMRRIAPRCGGGRRPNGGDGLVHVSLSHPAIGSHRVSESSAKASGSSSASCRAR